MSLVYIDELEFDELNETLTAFTDIFIEVGLLKPGTKAPEHLMSFDWASNEPEDPDWPRALVKAISNQWDTVTEAQAAAVLLERLTNLRPFDLGDALTASAKDNSATTFARTMNKVSPEFSQALEEQEAGDEDVAVRMMLSKVFNINPADPSDAFFVDATVYAYDELFSAPASSVIRDVLGNMAGMPEGAVGFALVLAGTNGCHKIWLEEPDTRATEVVLRMVADVIDNPDADLKELENDPSAIVAGVTVLCTFERSPAILSRMLSAVAKLLEVQGMLIITDPSVGCKHEALDSGSFHAIRTSDMLGLHHHLTSLPYVERFNELMELYEETTESFNERLVNLSSQIAGDLE